MVTHPSTNLYLCCLTSNSLHTIILPLSYWYSSKSKVLEPFYFVHNIITLNHRSKSLVTNIQSLVLPTVTNSDYQCIANTEAGEPYEDPHQPGVHHVALALHRLHYGLLCTGVAGCRTDSTVLGTALHSTC